MTDCGHDKIILELREENKKLREEINQLRSVVETLVKSNNELQQKMTYYENPHSPPSQNSLTWRQQKKEAKEKRDANHESGRGGITGHKGATQKFISQKTQHHESSGCPECGSLNIRKTKIKKRIMVGIPEPRPYTVTEHILYEYDCKDCDSHFQTDGNLPPQGSFDGSAVREVTNMFSKRMPYDMIRESLNERHGLQISCTTVQSILQTGQVLLEPEAEKIRNEICKSDVAGMDETQFPVDGKSAWMWVVRSKTAAHYAFECSRGAKVPRKHWKGFGGIVISDGYRPYATVFYDNIRQRCTAHLQRESKDVAKKSKDRLATSLYQRFSKILFRAKAWTGSNHSDIQRIRHANYLLEKVDDIINQYLAGNDEMMRFGNKLKTARNNMFTFVLFPGVPSTNNDTEGSIRKCIMQRNVRGQMKSSKGMKMLATFLTCFETWRIRGLDILSQMAKYI
jgi:transposase